MRFDTPFKEVDLKRSESVSVTSHMMADAQFEGVRGLVAFGKFYLNPLVKGLLNKQQREETVLGLHYRIMGYLLSILKLNAPIHFQSIAAIARSLYELGLDMAIFSQNIVNAPDERIQAFNFVERYRAAKNLVDFYQSRQLPPHLNINQERQFCSDLNNKAKKDELILRYWGKKSGYPLHWSGIGKIQDRAKRAGSNWEDRYYYYYAKFSWYVHSGLTGVVGISQDKFDVIAAVAYCLIKDVVFDSYKVLGGELLLPKAMPEWNKRMEFLSLIQGLALVDKQLQSLGEPMRFFYLEEHEVGQIIEKTDAS